MFEDPVSKSLEWSRKGYMGMALLLMINEKSMTGYDIMRLMREITDGSWRPTPGGVYPVLKKLEHEGLVQGAWSGSGGRRRALDRVLLKQSEIAFGINRLFESFLKDMFGFANPRVAPPGLFTLLSSEDLPDEIDALEARREMLLDLMQALQRCLEATEARIEALKRRSAF